MAEPGSPVELPPELAGMAADGWQVLRRAGELADRGEDFALATVVWRAAPSSGRPGARALITAAGEIHGWIGGACAEPVVLRAAQQVIRDREPRLLLLGTAEQFGGGVPDGAVVVPISCQSDGALEVFIEPVVPIPQVTVIGRSPMAHTLVDLVAALGWKAELRDGTGFTVAGLDHRSVVVVATQGHGDEEILEQVVRAGPAFVGVVASHKRGAGLLGYLADHGIAPEVLDRVQVPVGVDLGHTAHREMAVSVLAELVRLRAAGRLSASPSARPADVGVTRAEPADAIDPVCGMTVRADDSGRPAEVDGVTYYFCCPGCRRAFLKDPASFRSSSVPSVEGV